MPRDGHAATLMPPLPHAGESIAAAGGFDAAHSLSHAASMSHGAGSHYHYDGYVRRRHATYGHSASHTPRQYFIRHDITSLPPLPGCH